MNSPDKHPKKHLAKCRPSAGDIHAKEYVIPSCTLSLYYYPKNIILFFGIDSIYLICSVCLGIPSNLASLDMLSPVLLTVFLIISSVYYLRTYPHLYAHIVLSKMVRLLFVVIVSAFFYTDFQIHQAILKGNGKEAVAAQRPSSRQEEYPHICQRIHQWTFSFFSEHAFFYCQSRN